MREELGQHVCFAVSGPVDIGRSHVGIGSGIMLVGPHVQLGGPYADKHAAESSPSAPAGDSSDQWAMLPGPLRCSYSDAEGRHFPALFMGTARRMKQATSEKKRKLRH